MKKVLGSMITKETASVIFLDLTQGKSFALSLDVSHCNYSKVEQLIRGGESYEVDDLFELMSYEEAVNSAAARTSLDFQVKGGVVYYGDRKLDNALGAKLLEELANDNPVESWFEFTKKVLSNPSATAVKELSLFLEAGNIALCDDGDFLAYKKVRGDYMDIYTGTMDNSPGKIVEMERNAVDDVRDRTCSYGLHFCSYSYLGSYGCGAGDKVLLVKINPADVVSIPSDYANTKGRCCRYEVISEVSGPGDILKGAHGSQFIKTSPQKDEDEDEQDWDDEDEDWDDEDEEEDDDNDWG